VVLLYHFSVFGVYLVIVVGIIAIKHV